jgi:hypothetical protein
VRTKIKVRRLLIALAANLWIIAAAAAPTAAAGHAQPSNATSDGRHCTIRIEHVSADSAETRIVARTCFGTYAESLRYATRSRVAIPDNITPDQVTDAMVATGISDVVVIGTDYDAANYGSGTFTVNWETSGTCTSTRSWIVSDVGPTYNNHISSAKGYGGCHKFHHWELTGFGGAVLICQPNCPTMGVMNNQTSSLSWDY